MFKKYNSIDNHYQTKEIMRWLSEYPELENETFVLTEKVDGANIQLYFTPDGGFKYGKRSAFLSPDEKFFDLHELVAGPYKGMIDQLSAYSKKSLLGYLVRFMAPECRSALSTLPIIKD